VRFDLNRLPTSRLSPLQGLVTAGQLWTDHRCFPPGVRRQNLQNRHNPSPIEVLSAGSGVERWRESGHPPFP
jgi:hypothetical protein